uniref:Uncharacterized protein n=1 Tax=Anguilla anguilla TaxID=7936 RepID=A0A0E9S7P7_ANGAN
MNVHLLNKNQSINIFFQFLSTITQKISFT